MRVNPVDRIYLNRMIIGDEFNRSIASQFGSSTRSSLLDDRLRPTLASRYFDRVWKSVQNDRLFSHVQAVMDPDPHNVATDQNGIKSFLECWFAPLPTDLTKDCYPPERLAHASSAADGLLKEGMTAVTDDLQSTLIHPLLQEIQELPRHQPAASGNVSVVGKTTIVASSRVSAGVAGSAESYVPFTPANQVTTGSLGTNFSLADTFKTAGLQSILAAALLNQSPTVFTSLTTGLGLQVRPTALIDGGARLQLTLQSTETPDTTNVNAGGHVIPNDLINGQLVSTDINVDSFDLFELSTFGIDSTRPGDVAWRVPVLDGLPVFGPMFRGPQHNVQKHQESLVILNISVLPRSIELAHSYTSMTYGSFPAPSAAGQ